MPTLSLIIAVYKRLDALELVLQGLARQSFSDFEVVIAEDDDAPQTRAFVRAHGAAAAFPVKHVFQEDRGFRKNRALNAALRVARGEYVVLLDGDCIPHRHFMHEYARRLRPRVALYGRRAMLTEQFTLRLLRDKDLSRLHWLQVLLAGGRKAENALYLPWLPSFKRSSVGIWGCNWGIARRHLLEVNGFDEDYVKAGIGEDVDIEWRLSAIGVTLRAIKHQAIVYHLHHRAHYDLAIVQENEEICRRKREAGRYVCMNGLEKLDAAAGERGA